MVLSIVIIFIGLCIWYTKHYYCISSYDFMLVFLAYVKFENLMILHYAQVCQFVIMSSEATPALLIKCLKNHLTSLLIASLRVSVVMERIPQMREDFLCLRKYAQTI